MQEHFTFLPKCSQITGSTNMQGVLPMKKPLIAAFLSCAAIILSGCNTSQVLSVQSPNGEGTQSLATVSDNVRVRFDPVIGAPADASSQLETQFPALAAQNGLRLAGAGDSSATHVAQGYFSAITDNGTTTVIYVWDISNASGTRLHRIQGQVKSQTQSGEGWASVGPETMQTIAAQTMNQLTAWLAASAG
jgi:hypothetical protein